MRSRHSPVWLAAAAIGLLLQASSAHAYLDPSTGSMILSAIVGVFATAALALKTFWYRIKALFRRESPPADPPVAPGTDARPGQRVE